MDRIPASERTREKLKALMEGRSVAEDGRSELVRLAAPRSTLSLLRAMRRQRPQPQPHCIPDSFIQQGPELT